MTTQTGQPYLYADAAADVLATGTKEILMIAWVSDQASGKDIAADDDFLLSDANGNRIIGKRAEVAGDDLGLVPCQPLPVNGITVTTMDGGVCYVWVVA